MERIEDCISFLTGKAAQVVAKRTRAKLSPFGVTPTQYAVLWVLWQTDGQSASDIGARLAIDSATTTGVIDRLEAAGFLERRPDPGDRRVHRLHLTPAGRRLNEPLDAAMDELNREVAEWFEGRHPDIWTALRRLGGLPG